VGAEEGRAVGGTNVRTPGHLTISVRPEVADFIRQVAEEEDRTVSSVLRSILERWRLDKLIAAEPISRLCDGARPGGISFSGFQPFACKM
jgi:hypothetical protein